MAEMTADGWIPTGGRRPEGLPGIAKVDTRIREGFCAYQQGIPADWLEGGWGFISHYRLTDHRLAQPAAQECNCGAIPELESHLSSCITRAAGPSDAATINAGPGSAIGVARSDSPVPAPYRSRNGYGLRIREAEEREREPLLISYDVFRRMK